MEDRDLGYGHFIRLDVSQQQYTYVYLITSYKVYFSMHLVVSDSYTTPPMIMILMTDTINLLSHVFL
jgi:hypothetical protein